MARELVNAQISHISYVDKAANKKQFFFTKSAIEPTFEKEVKIFLNKDEEEQQLVYGIVYEPGSADDESTHDSHGDFMDSAEIEKAAHIFMKDARNIDKQHDFESGVGEVVESYIAPADFEIGEETITKGSWVLVTKATDEIWEEVKDGSLTGYSMAGTAETIEKQAEEPPIQSGNDEEKGLFNLLKNFFTKGEVRDGFQENVKRRNLFSVWEALDKVFYDSIWNARKADVADFERIESAATEFLEIVREIKSSEDIEKALKDRPDSIRKGDDDMKAEDITKAVTDALGPIAERLDAVEKEIKKEAPEPEVTEDNAALDQFKDVLKEALTPIAERLETVEKARGISKQADGDKGQEQDQDPIQKHYLNGIL